MTNYDILNFILKTAFNKQPRNNECEVHIHATWKAKRTFSHCWYLITLFNWVNRRQGVLKRGEDRDRKKDRHSPGSSATAAAAMLCTHLS